MKRLTEEEVHAYKVTELGLDPAALDLTSIESIAAALRRAAGFLCPCGALTLVRAVVRPLDGLVPDINVMKESVEVTLEAMIAHGDLLEERDVGDDNANPHRGALLYAAPPSFVTRHSGAALLLGIAPDQLLPLPDQLQARVEYFNHVRRLPVAGEEELRTVLTQLGLVELSLNDWLKSPPAETPAQYVSRIDQSLEDGPASVDIPGLMLLDPSRPVRYYRGRWVEPRSHTGRFVGRRNQAYGADLWCYVQVRNGRPERFLDLPLTDNRARGCDEAWRLQMAIDAQRGDPQTFRLCQGRASTCVLELFSPVPMWARRRWDAVGEPVPRSGCLFAYRFPETEIPEELRFIRDMLWLAELREESR